MKIKPFSIALIAIFTLLAASISTAKTATKEGEWGKNIIAETIHGKPFEYRVKKQNKPVVLLFSDSLCPFHHLPNCENELAEFNRLVKKHGDKVKFVQVLKAYYTDKDTILGYNKKFNIDVPTVWDTDNRIFSNYGVFANPYVVLLDKNGRVSFRRDDFIAELDGKITGLTK